MDHDAKLTERMRSLPQWAQREFIYLKRDLKDAQENFAALQGANGSGKVVADVGFKSEFNLPDDCSVRMGGYEFKLEDDGTVHVWGRDVGAKGDVCIRPHSGNTFILTFIKRKK